MVAPSALGNVTRSASGSIGGGAAPSSGVIGNAQSAIRATRGSNPIPYSLVRLWRTTLSGTGADGKPAPGSEIDDVLLPVGQITSDLRKLVSSHKIKNISLFPKGKSVVYLSPS